MSSSRGAERRAVSGYFFPEEVMVKILSKLPHRSLLRFRSVSKSWLSLIGTPGFYSRNLLNDSLVNPSCQKQNSLLFIRRTVPVGRYKSKYLLVTYNTLDDSTSEITHLPPSVPDKIEASCNGLFCLTYVNHIYLWNPATAELKELPNFIAVGHLVDVCFGFDASPNDYKVVRIYSSREHVTRVSSERGMCSSGDFEECEAEVYGLSSGCWRKIDVGHDVVPYYMGLSDNWSLGLSDKAYVNGVYFAWKVHRYNNANEIIVAFDMTQEVFKLIPLPDASVIGDYKMTSRNLTVLNESLALILSPRHDQNKEKGFDIWVLFEFGVKESWTRLATINPPFKGLQRTLGMWNSGGWWWLIVVNAEGQLVLYDLFTQTVRILPLDGNWYSFEVFMYTPTPFLIDTL